MTGLKLPPVYQLGYVVGNIDESLRILRIDLWCRTLPDHR